MSLFHKLALFLLLAQATCAGRERAPRPRPFEPLSYEASTGTVHARRAGTEGGPRIVFVHGTPGDADAWRPYLRQPFHGWDLVAVDRPGFGESAPRGAVTSLATQAAALAPLLDPNLDPNPEPGLERGEGQAAGRRLGPPVVLVGHSLGAAVVARVAVDHPDRVAGLVLLAGSVDPELERLRWYNILATPLEWLLSRSLRNANREIRALRRELVALGRELERIECPVLVIHGTDDSLVPYANVDYLRRTLGARAEIVSLEGADHFFIWSRSEGIARTVGRFLARLPGAPPGALEPPPDPAAGNDDR